MKASIQNSEQSSLLVKWALTAITQRTVLPVLSTVLCEAGVDTMTFHATDLDVYVGVVIPCKNEGIFKTIIPHNVLRQVVACDKLTFDKDGTNRLKINGMTMLADPISYVGDQIPADEFPPIPKVAEKTKPMVVEAKLFLDMLRFVSAYQCEDEARYVLNGTYVSVVGSALYANATDGRRLGFAHMLIQHDMAEKHSNFHAIIPRKTVRLLLDMPVQEGYIHISLHENWIQFDYERTSIVSKLIEGNYPNWRQVIPNDADLKAQLSIPLCQLKMALDWINPLVNHKLNSVALNFSGNVIHVRKKGEDGQVAECHVQMCGDSKDFTQAFNPQYLMTLINGFEGHTQFTWKYFGDLSPAVISNGNHTAVIMPMRES